jgi:outer membrane protein assembly factor BamA
MQNNHSNNNDFIFSHPAKQSFVVLLGCLLLFTYSTSFAQNKKVKVIINDTILSSKQQKELLSTSTNSSFINIYNIIKNINQQLYKNAYLTAHIDSIISDSTTYFLHYHLGKQIKWTNLTTKTIDEGILSKIGFRDKIYNNRPFNQNQLKRFFDKVISFYENHGYPFASIQLDSVQITDYNLSANLSINKKQLYKIDSVAIKGSATVSDDYIKNYIRINDEDIYNEELIKKINTRIKEIPFVEEQNPSKVIFNEESAYVLLVLKKKQANRFNGILGIVPDEAGKVRLNGDVKLNLMNSFKRGEEISFNWRAMQNNSQDLKLSTAYPFLFNSPFGAEYQLNLYKRDSTYIDVFNKIGVRYILKGNNYFNVFYHNKSSNLLSQKGFETLTVLPDFADVSTQLYGIGIVYDQLDYIHNPRRGFSINANGSLGNKKISKNPQLNEQLYKDVNLKTNLYTAQANLALYIPIKKRSVIKLGTQNGYTYNENLFDNEMLRIGGLHTLRGVDEESIFASFYSITTIEYRFILEQNSFLYLFTDGAFWEKRTANAYSLDRPYSFGVGMNFETNAGIFSISYAVGKQFDNPIQFRSAKIHFGFINFF